LWRERDIKEGRRRKKWEKKGKGGKERAKVGKIVQRWKRKGEGRNEKVRRR
jgi:hypothetical protein